MQPHASSVDPPDAEILVGECVVCFASEDWWYHNSHSNKHLMQVLARTNNNRVLFVNSIGMSAPHLLHDRFARRRVARKLHSLLIFLRRVEPNLFVLTPIALPVTRRLRRLIGYVNRILIIAQVRAICGWLGFSTPIIWTTSPAAGTAAIALRHKWARLLVYYCIDNLAFSRGVDDTAYIQSLDTQLQSAADLVFFSGRRLFQERAQQRSDIYLLPHGVDYELFGRAQGSAEPLPADLHAIAQPVVGYIGLIRALDLELIAHIAARNKHVSFVFIGDLAMEVDSLSTHGNVHWLGKKAYEDLPRYLQGFRCCLLCYRRGDIFNAYRSPKKLLEYFATGLPVVALQLAELHAYAHLVYQASNAQEFDLQLQRALAEADPDLRRLRIEAARERDWRVVVAEASRHIRNHLLLNGDNARPPRQVLQSSSYSVSKRRDT
jgi:glycosyltransferase involved in cell wall biosynthesis